MLLGPQVDGELLSSFAVDWGGGGGGESNPEFEQNVLVDEGDEEKGGRGKGGEGVEPLCQRGTMR